MRKAIKGLGVLISLAMLFLMSVPSASATKPVLTIANTNLWVETITSEQIVNDKVIKWTWEWTWGFEGDWIGIVEWECKGIWHTEGDPWAGDGVLYGVTYQCLGTFEGTVLGKSGSVFISTVWNIGFKSESPRIVEPFTIHGGTGELEGIHGVSHLGVPSAGMHGKTWHNVPAYWAWYIHFE